MHASSYEKMAGFVEVHLDRLRGTPLSILDFGSQVVDDQGQSYRPLFDDPAWAYRGLDISPGHNVDVVVDDPYDWSEIPTASVDLVISGQAFEHVEFFWASMFEIQRVLKPGGLATIIAPSGGFEHRYPVDCWRFYRDGFDALARHVGGETCESFTDWGHLDWEDSLLVARKPTDHESTIRLHRRGLLQRAILLDEPDLDLVTGSWNDLPTAVEPSALHTVEPGVLTSRLEAARDRRQSEAAAAATADRTARDAMERELRTLRETVHAIEQRPSAAARWYGAVRSKIAAVAGPAGRSAYKRLRGRPESEDELQPGASPNSSSG